MGVLYHWYTFWRETRSTWAEPSTEEIVKVLLANKRLLWQNTCYTGSFSRRKWECVTDFTIPWCWFYWQGQWWWSSSYNYWCSVWRKRSNLDSLYKKKTKNIKDYMCTGILRLNSSDVGCSYAKSECSAGAPRPRSWCEHQRQWSRCSFTTCSTLQMWSTSNVEIVNQSWESDVNRRNNEGLSPLMVAATIFSGRQHIFTSWFRSMCELCQQQR